MSKESLLFAEACRKFSEALLNLADALEKCKQEAEQEPAQAKAEVTNAPMSSETNLTLEEVRAVLADKSRQGFTKEIKGLLQQHGANKLSQVDPREYQTLLQEAEELQHA